MAHLSLKRLADVLKHIDEKIKRVREIKEDGYEA
jgi:hypothetical protein